MEGLPGHRLARGSVTRLFIIRHGQTDWNVVGRLQGSTDIPLNDIGRAQAETASAALMRVLETEPIVVTSPLERARDTAQIIAAAAGVPVEADDRLRERAYGVWEGHTMAEIAQQWPQEYEKRKNGIPYDLPGMESDAATGNRVAAAAREWCADAERDVVFVSHGSAARMGVTVLAGLPLTGRALGNIPNTAWSVLRGSGDTWLLERHAVSAAWMRDTTIGAAV